MARPNKESPFRRAEYSPASSLASSSSSFPARPRPHHYRLLLLDDHPQLFGTSAHGSYIFINGFCPGTRVDFSGKALGLARVWTRAWFGLWLWFWLWLWVAGQSPDNCHLFWGPFANRNCMRRYSFSSLSFSFRFPFGLRVSLAHID